MYFKIIKSNFVGAFWMKNCDKNMFKMFISGKKFRNK